MLPLPRERLAKLRWNVDIARSTTPLETVISFMREKSKFRCCRTSNCADVGINYEMAFVDLRSLRRQRVVNKFRMEFWKDYRENSFQGMKIIQVGAIRISFCRMSKSSWLYLWFWYLKLNRLMSEVQVSGLKFMNSRIKERFKSFGYSMQIF